MYDTDTNLVSGAKFTLVKIGTAAFKYIKPLLGEAEDIVDAALWGLTKDDML